MLTVHFASPRITYFILAVQSAVFRLQNFILQSRSPLVCVFVRTQLYARTHARLKPIVQY
jgi:hypothetical protein